MANGGDEMKRIFVISVCFILSIMLCVNFSAYAETKNISNECVEDVVDLHLDDIRSVYIAKYSDSINNIGVEITGENVKVFFNKLMKNNIVESDDSSVSVAITFYTRDYKKPNIMYNPEQGFYTYDGILSEKIISSDRVIEIVEELGYKWTVNNAGAGPTMPGGFSDVVIPSENTSNGRIEVFIENEEVCVVINDKSVIFNDKLFIDENGRTQVPVRELCEFLNKRVYWYENPKRVAISTVTADLDNTNGGGAGGDSIQFVIGENKYSRNGREYPMDTAARIINNRTYIPLRIAGEFLNYEVIWQE